MIIFACMTSRAIQLELDPRHKRCEWKMVRIVGSYPGNKGLVQKVRINAAAKEELNAEQL